MATIDGMKIHPTPNQAVTVTLPDGTTITGTPEEVGRVMRAMKGPPPQWELIGVVDPHAYRCVPRGYFDPATTPIITCEAHA